MEPIPAEAAESAIGELCLMNSIREQDVQVCMQMLNKVYLHMGESYAQVVTSLLQIQHEAASTECHPYIAQMNQYLLNAIAKHYTEIAEITFQEVLVFLKHEAVQASLPFEEASGGLPF